MLRKVGHGICPGHAGCSDQQQHHETVKQSTCDKDSQSIHWRRDRLHICIISRDR